jgi:hypothetical protein
MNNLSNHLIDSITDAQQSKAHRASQRKRLAKGAEDQPKKSLLGSLKKLATNMLYGPHLPNEVEYSEQTLYHAEMLGLSPEELHRQQANRRMYERIAQGNALVEAEYLAQKTREGRL